MSDANSIAADIQNAVDAQRAAADPVIRAMMAQQWTEVEIVVALGKLDGRHLTPADARREINKERGRIAECVRRGFLKMPEGK